MLKKPDIENIEIDNMNAQDLTSESSNDDTAGTFKSMFGEKTEKKKAKDKLKKEKASEYAINGYGDRDKYDFQTYQVTKNDKKYK